MYNNSFSDSDDDLFEESTQVAPNPFINNTSSNYSSDSKDNSTSDKIKSLLDSMPEIDGDFKSLIFRSKLAITFYNGASQFTSNKTSFDRTVFNTLNTLTNGQFQYQLYADQLEEVIVRRTVILDFVEAMIEEADNKALSKLSEMLKINIDSKFINTYFASLAVVMNFTINDQIELYNKVCSFINRTPLDFTNRLDFIEVSDVTNAGKYISTSFISIDSQFDYSYGNK